MKRYRAPGFGGKRALLLLRDDDDGRPLLRQLEQLGMRAEVVAPGELRAALASARDVIVFDADLAHDELFPWQHTPVPLVALLGAETPGRLELIMRLEAHASLLKPVRSSGVYGAMVMAAHNFELNRETRSRLAELEEKLRARPLVFDSLLKIMRAADCDQNQAYESLRNMAMSERVSVEEISLLIASDSPAVLERLLRGVRRRRQGD